MNEQEKNINERNYYYAERACAGEAFDRVLTYAIKTCKHERRLPRRATRGVKL